MTSERGFYGWKLVFILWLLDFLNMGFPLYGGAVINTYPYICDPDATTPKTLPAAIEISFNAMSPQAARAVMSVTSDPSVWMNMDANLVKPHAYQFRSRINLP